MICETYYVHLLRNQSMSSARTPFFDCPFHLVLRCLGYIQLQNYFLVDCINECYIFRVSEWNARMFIWIRKPFVCNWREVPATFTVQIAVGQTGNGYSSSVTILRARNESTDYERRRLGWLKIMRIGQYQKHEPYSNFLLLSLRSSDTSLRSSQKRI